MAAKQKQSTKFSQKKSPTGGRKRVNFQVVAKPGSDVKLAGSFNNWNGR